MPADEKIIFEEKVNQVIVYLVCIAGYLGSAFFFFKGLLGDGDSVDLMGGAGILFVSSTALLYFGTVKKYLILLDSKFVFERKTLFGRNSQAIFYKELVGIEVTEYLANLEVKIGDSSKIKFSQNVNQIAGVPLVQSGADASNPIRQRMTTLRDELIRRKGMLVFSGKSCERRNNFGE